MMPMQRNAFTLVELLVVLAIIAILAAIAFPAVTGFLDKSKSAKCVANLRQIGSAALAYTGDNAGRLPPISSPQGWWPALLSPYLGSSTNSGNPVWRCPAVTDGQIVTANGNTHYGYGPCKPIMDFSTSKQKGSLRLSQLPYPQRTWLFGDIGKPIGGIPSDSAPNEGYTTCGSIQRSYLEGHTPACRHIGGTLANVVFCDGHVESLPWSAFVEKNNPLFGYNTNTGKWDF